MKSNAPAMGVIALLLTACVMFIHGQRHDHSCNAPCTVHFKEPVAEDDVAWNWTLHNNAYVYKNTDH